MSIKALKPAEVKYIAVHCSASPAANDKVDAKEIDRWHRLRGFIKIGYHYVIKRDGTVETGRPLTERGAHVEDFNHCSIGICLVGGVDATPKMKAENNFTDAQFASLKTLLQELRPQFPTAVIQGHRDFPNVAKDCPSFDVKAWMKQNNV